MRGGAANTPALRFGFEPPFEEAGVGAGADPLNGDGDVPDPDPDPDPDFPDVGLGPLEPDGDVPDPDPSFPDVVLGPLGPLGPLPFTLGVVGRDNGVTLLAAAEGMFFSIFLSIAIKVKTYLRT